MPRANQYTTIDLVPPHKKIFQTYKNWHLKTLFGRRSQVRSLPDGWVDGPEPLFPRRDTFLVRVAPLTWSGVSPGTYC